jgi:hypothetical protein
VTEEERAPYKHPAVAAIAWVGLTFYLVGLIFDSWVASIGMALAGAFCVLLGVYILRKRRYRAIALAVILTTGLLVGIWLVALFVPSRWGWLAVGLLLLLFFASAAASRHGRVQRFLR